MNKILEKRNIIEDWLIVEYSNQIPNQLGEVLKIEGIKDRWILPASRIIHRLSEMPWYSQKELMDETGLSLVELIELNKIIRDSEFPTLEAEISRRL